MRIAILEDSAEQLERVATLLRAAGHLVHGVAQGRALLARLRTESYDLLVIDWELPDVSGLEVLKALRGPMGNRTPVLFLTHRDAEADVVEALSSGADDFLSKPPREQELLARVDSLARRGSGIVADPEILHVGPFTLDRRQRQIRQHDRPFDLTPREFAVAALLFSHVGKVLSRGHIMESIWGHDSVATTRTVDMHVSRVRRVLGLSTSIGLRLTAVYGYGYRLERTAPGNS